MGKFGLELHPEKTRLIEFGRYAAERRAKREEGSRRPLTFWVSPTFVERATRRAISRYTEDHRQTYGSQAEGLSCEAAAADARENPGNAGVAAGRCVRGYFLYHAIPGNEERLKAFLHEVSEVGLRTLRRRSQRTRWTWSDLWSDSASCYLRFDPTPYRRSASTPNIQGRNRVRESRQHGTVRGCRATGIPTATHVGVRAGVLRGMPVGIHGMAGETHCSTMQEL